VNDLKREIHEEARLRIAEGMKRKALTEVCHGLSAKFGVPLRGSARTAMGLKQSSCEPTPEKGMSGEYLFLILDIRLRKNSRELKL
jgi:hypothetical protein